jgi:7-cyano-7-deazaguanine synthase in queuosine biosynthesis
MDSMDDAARVLWTGGWDSTFRVLQLVLAYQRRVEPHYILNPERRSSLHELRAMTTIRRRLAVEHPEAAPRILPLRLVVRQDLAGDRAHAEHLAALRSRNRLGRQYTALADYAEAMAIDDLELCVEIGGRAEALLRGHVAREEDVGGGYWRLADNTAGDLVLFARFRFPILNMTKLDIKVAARDMGVLDMMRLTWFCHRPRGEKPCGRCAPCSGALEEGMGDRLPRQAHLRYWVARTRRTAGNIARRVIAA